ncbi:MAG: single-stranded DNA-binding protein [Spirochaetales bacterium]|nr:single-stranded DNA-binding protein [Spirochaetales bacterium]
MNNLNSVLIEGNLVRDPELTYTPKGTPVCKFSVATNRFFKQDDEYQKEVSYFDVTTWSRLAEVCGEYLTKGRGVRVVGRLKQDRWEDPEGNTRTKVQIVAEHVEFKPQVKTADTQTGNGPAGEKSAEHGLDDLIEDKSRRELEEVPAG